MRSLRTIVAALLAAGLFPPVLAASPCAGFLDVEDTNPFCVNVAWLKNRSITLGCAPNLYCPDDFTSRLQMAAFLNRLADSLFPLTCAAGSVMKWDGSAWVCAPAGAGGGITSLAPGAGIVLSPNPITTTGTIAADAGYLQRRVTPGCAAGSSIRTINADGSVVCQLDTIGGGTVTSVTAGAGLTGGTITTSGTLAVDTAAIQARVTGSCTPGSWVRAIAADGTVTCEAHDRIIASTTFTAQTVPAAPSPPAMLASLTFTPQRSGGVRVTSAGHCNQAQLNTEASQIEISAGTSEGDAFAVPSAKRGVLRVPAAISPATSDWALMWTSERDYTVTGASPTTIRLYGRHATGFVADDCSGWFTVEGPIQ
jgi:hypothetical protein